MPIGIPAICRPWSVTSGALMGMVLKARGLSPVPQPAPAVPAQLPRLRPAPASVADRMTRAVPDLYFEVNSHVLSARERRKLAQLAPALESLIEGHSDDCGLVEYNDRLALERADAVWRVLLELGFPEDRPRTVGFAYRAPQCPSLDDLCRHTNRRVHFRAARAVADTRIPSGAGGGRR